jgi:hypothetical protein
MPAFEWSAKHDAFVKICSACRKVHIGAETQEKAEEVLHNFFKRHTGTSDGFNSLCRRCDGKISIEWKRKWTYQLEKSREDMLAEQNGRCGVCSKPISLGRDMYEYRASALVDHDHKTGKVRGLLCNFCNSHLGPVESDWLEKAQTYLQRFKK